MGILPRWSRRRGYQEIVDPISNETFETLFEEHSHLDVTRRLTIGLFRTGGGYSCVYLGVLRSERCWQHGSVVAIKLLRYSDQSEAGTKVCKVYS